METIDIIRQLCSQKGISLAQLESDLEYGNGSLAKSKNMSADRLYKIAQYFGVSMEYLITGKTITEADDEVSILRQQQSILMEINKVSQLMSDYYKKIAECQDKLNQLKKDYSKLETKKKSSEASSSPNEDPLKYPDLFDLFSNDDELPFN